MGPLMCQPASGPPLRRRSAKPGARESVVDGVEVPGVQVAHLGLADRCHPGHAVPRRQRRRVVDVVLALDLDRAGSAGTPPTAQSSDGPISSVASTNQNAAAVGPSSASPALSAAAAAVHDLSLAVGNDEGVQLGALKGQELPVERASVQSRNRHAPTIVPAIREKQMHTPSRTATVTCECKRFHPVPLESHG